MNAVAAFIHRTLRAAGTPAALFFWKLFVHFKGVRSRSLIIVLRSLKPFEHLFIIELRVWVVRGALLILLGHASGRFATLNYSQLELFTSFLYF
ncbi:hypothetical protein A2853_01360 [Candidatus Kaiserbacteria bacterium RIFCSPHIGHO2_01_FULL_55_17]|uniref:Uncharacterized protein n=1 Tax=Candidatus Kaiserbacteria bacterium RIFCSPHIGHO2_01_FULL_55_17 TaxID=1798484 RepID=A0A1F6D9R3_9BACT|nr:MAG: hypothetical protein A2853_01360 [Candidatus Kaiserbacteria bacterium RIFCSPHIGHO2_01_FULL_55_17]